MAQGSISRRQLIGAGFAVVSGLKAQPSLAQGKRIKIGVMTDLSGIYADLSGPGSVIAAQMAVSDFQQSAGTWTVEVVSADMQNKADIGATIARQWIDIDGVDLIIDVPNSAVALAVNEIVRQKNRVYIGSGTATSALTGQACSPNTVHWTFDTYQLSTSVARALTAGGGDSWFFITSDNAFGTALQKDATAALEAGGGKVLGSVRVPLNTPDFSSFLLQAQASKAKVIALATAGADTINLVKQAAEFGVGKGQQKIAPLVLFLTDVHSMGLQLANGLTFSETFYWDLNDRTRAFADRFAKQARNGMRPTMVHAGVYAGVSHFLRAVKETDANLSDGAAVVRSMKQLIPSDPLFGKGEIQSNGRKVHPAYIFEVKAPSESRAPWDYYKLVAEVPADKAFRSVAESQCTLAAR